MEFELEGFDFLALDLLDEKLDKTIPIMINTIMTSMALNFYSNFNHISLMAVCLILFLIS